MQARERHTIRTHLTIIADHVYGSNQESQGRWWNPFSWKTDAHGWSKRCSWPVYIGMTMALGVCSALSRLYNVERCTTLIGLVNGTDAVIATVGGSTAVMFDQWKRSEMVYWYVHTMALCALVPALGSIFATMILYETATFYPLVLVLFTLAVSLALYYAMGRRSGNRAMLLALIDDLDDAPPLPKQE